MGKSGVSRVAPIGKRFGKLVVISGSRPGINTNSSAVICRCDCGDERSHSIGNLLRFKGEPMCPRCREQARPARGFSGKHPLFNIWKAMIQRCENPAHTHYASYGGRGISICDRWRQDFTAFASDMGERPSLDHTIDRINNFGNYEPKNCRWAIPEVQGNNRREQFHHYVDWNGEKLTLAEAARLAGISKELFHWRLKRGWSMDRSMNTPPRRKAA